MLAMVMAGGKGTRLRPLTCEKPKPMVPVANRPLLEYVLRHLAANGWDELVITLCYQPDKIESFFGEGSKFGVKLHYLLEDRPLGTAGSVKMGERLFDGTVLVASGDALCDFDLRGALAFHRDRGSLATIVLTRVESPLEYGMVITDPDGRIKKLLEKPGWGEVFSDTVNTGFYLIEPEVFGLVPSGEAFDFSRDLFPALLARGGGLYGYIATGYWSDIGTIEQYRRTHLDILAGRVRLTMPGREIGTMVWVGEGTEIDPEAVIEGPVLIGDYCRIERGARLGAYSVLGDHNFLAEEASLKHSILWRHVHVGRTAEVRGAIVGDHAIIRNGAAVYEGAVIGDGCLIGAYGVVRPRVKVWPDKDIESGSTVRESLIWSERSLRGLFGAIGVSGLANLEITPEFAARLGAAYATALGPGRRVAVAADGLPATRLLKCAAMAGILGVGLGVSDLGTATVPVTRFGISHLGLAGGVHLGLARHDPRLAVVQFLDARGLPIGRPAERAVEQSFSAEDFLRADASQVGELSYPPGLVEMYLDRIRDSVDALTIRTARIPLVLGSMAGPAATILPGLLERLGCPYVWAAEPVSDRLAPIGAEAFRGGREAIAAKLAEAGAVMAVAVDITGEELLLLAPGGRAVRPEQLATVLSLAELKRREGARLPVPVTASAAIGDLARTFRGQLIRTKAHRRSLLEEFAAESPTVQGLVLPAFDALVSLARLLEFMATNGRDLGGIIANLPAYERVERAVKCAWGEKGRLMRRLIEESRGHQVELTDGLRVEEEGGWTLIMPDGEGPFIRICSEAGTEEEADAMSEYYLDRIAAIQQEALTPAPQPEY